MSIYISKNRCKFFLKIHLIIVSKYRKKIISGIIQDDLKKIISDIEKNSSFKIDVMESDIDHLHLLLDIVPNYSISSIVNRIKSISTNRIWIQHREFLRKIYLKKCIFWSDGYFVCSIGNASPETVRKYIENQG
jgi:putative transposase